MLMKNALGAYTMCVPSKQADKTLTLILTMIIVVGVKGTSESYDASRDSSLNPSHDKVVPGVRGRGP